MRTTVTRHHIIGCGFALLAAWLLLQPYSLAAQEAASEAGEVDRIFAAFNSSESPGCAVGVSRNGKTILARSYGMAELQHGVRSTPATVYEAGSVAKQFTAAALVLLAVDGKVSLDDPVRKYVPELPDYGVPLTLSHLLNHSNGLRDWDYVAAISGWVRTERSNSMAHVLDILSRQQSLNYTPGERYSYTNSGFNLAAIIVERVSGMSFADFSKKRIFDPLGMTSTQWRDDFRRIVPGRATAYVVRPGPATGQPGTAVPRVARGERDKGFAIDQTIENVVGNGGLLTTVQDLLTWTHGLEKGTLGPQFVQWMHETRKFNSGQPMTYARGLRIGTYRGVPEVSHGGSTAGYRAFLARYPQQQLGVALLCNVSSANSDSLGHRVADVFLGDLPPEPAPTTPAPASLTTAALQQKVGLYRETKLGDPLRLVLDGGKLRVEGGPVLTPISQSSFQAGTGEQRYTFAASREGSRSGFRVSVGAWEEEAYEPVDESRPDVAKLADFVGDFDSREAEVTLTIALEEGGLVLHRRPNDRFALKPVYADAFESPLGLIRFYRNARGRVIEFGLRQDRVYDIRFRRDVR